LESRLQRCLAENRHFSQNFLKTHPGWPHSHSGFHLHSLTLFSAPWQFAPQCRMGLVTTRPPQGSDVGPKARAFAPASQVRLVIGSLSSSRNRARFASGWPSPPAPFALVLNTGTFAVLPILAILWYQVASKIGPIRPKLQWSLLPSRTYLPDNLSRDDQNQALIAAIHFRDADDRFFARFHSEIAGEDG